MVARLQHKARENMVHIEGIRMQNTAAECTVFSSRHSVMFTHVMFLTFWLK